MAITRRQLKKISPQHSRRLRSGAVFDMQPVKWPPVQQPHQNRRKRARQSPLPVRPVHGDGRTGHLQSQVVKNNESSNLDSDGLLLGSEEAAGRDDPARPRTAGEEGSLNLQNNLNSIADEATSQLALTPDVAIETVVQNPEDVGPPQGDKWDHVAAHECRFCIQHEEDEWLLRSVNRWMAPSDFDVSGAETALKAKLQKYQLNPWDLNINHLASRAECNGSLWSHVDTPIERGKFGDEVVYLIRWKLCWTRQSHIDDMSWVRSSFKAQNERIQRRRSARVEETALKRVARRDAMMVVVKLEDWL